MIWLLLAVLTHLAGAMLVGYLFFALRDDDVPPWLAAVATLVWPVTILLAFGAALYIMWEERIE